jgi:hypothetical protein
MTIYLDPSECREDSRLPISVIKAGVQLPGLEHFTGADMLISTIDKPRLREVSNSTPVQLALRKHLDHGMLVQRKTTDLASSTDDLKYNLDKMKNAAPYFGFWLLVAADICSNREGELLINGKHQKSGFRDDSVRVIEEKWQFRGGCIKRLKYDYEITEWIRDMDHEMSEIEKHPTKVLEFRKPVQVIVGDGKNNLKWRSTLASIDGIGIKRATAIAEYCGSLAASIAYISDTTNLFLPSKPDDVGIKTFTKAQAWLGLEPDQIIVVGHRDQFGPQEEPDTPVELVRDDGTPIAIELPIKISASAGGTGW